MNPSISSQAFQREPFCAAHAESVRNHGFGEIEMYAMPPHFDCRDGNAVKNAADVLRAAGVAVAAVHLPYLYRNPATGRNAMLTPCGSDADAFHSLLEFMRVAADAAAVLDSRVLVVHCGTYKEPIEGSRVSALAEFLAFADQLLNGTGVRVALENVASPLSDPAFLCRMMDGYGFESAGVCVDVAHANLGGDSTAALRGAAHRLLHVHLSDNHGTRDDHLVPMRGGIDWPGVMSTLRSMNYAGHLTFEPRGADPETLLKDCRIAWDGLVELA